MAFSPQFEFEYISAFAKAVRGGASPRVWNEYAQRIGDALVEIENLKLKSEAQQRFVKISNNAFILIEDPKGSHNLIADELDEFADFVRKIK
jgi:hypothetical protein